MTYDPQQISDHTDQGLAKLLEQFREKPYLEALLKSYLDQIQKLENAIWEVILIRGIDASEGVNLDHIGRVVGRARLGLGDVDYRLALKAQIRINRSSGTPEDMIDVTRLSIPTTQDFTYDEAYPATIVIEVLGQSLFTILVLLDNLVRAKKGGVRLLLETSIEEDAFTFSEDDSAPDDLAHGLGDDLDSSVGGHLTDVLEG